MDMHQMLLALYQQMMPLCESLTHLSMGIGATGALLYVSIRIWRTLSDGSPFCIYEYTRPFGVGLMVMFFPSLVLGTINGILGAVSDGTASLVEEEQFSVAEYRNKREEARRKKFAEDPQTMFLSSDEEFDRELEELGWSPKDLATMSKMFMERAYYSVQDSVSGFLNEIMKFLFEASSLIIDTLRTFFLVVLSILGPISFSISIWEGFQGTIIQWLSRYIQVYLWLPVSHIFSCMLSKLEGMIIQNEITVIETGSSDGSPSSWIYLLFMAIGIMGYFSIPTVSEWIVQAGGGMATGSYGRNINKVPGTMGRVVEKIIKK